MGKNVKVRYKRKWAVGWGLFLLLAAALVISNQFTDFLGLKPWGIVVAALAVAFLIQSLVDLSFSTIPIPLAALYYVFQRPLLELMGLPEENMVKLWVLALVAGLATAGLFVLLPKRVFRRIKKNVEIVYTDSNGVTETRNLDDKTKIEESGGENNPRISVQFGSLSRYLHAENLETVELDCSFGSLEVYLDNVKLSPGGAEAFVDCKFGAIEMYVPKHWVVTDNVNTSLGNFENSGRNNQQDENAPHLKVSGNVSLGSIEVKRI